MQKTTVRAAAAIAFAVLTAGATQAASISYGNFGPDAAGQIFNGVMESSGTDGVPLYGPPQLLANGLDFDPTSFVASASNGTTDTTDGQLNFAVDTVNNTPINSLSLNEGGDFTLVGSGGTAATAVFAGAIIRVTVTEINGLAVTPFTLPTSSASVGFNLVSNGGVVQPWSLGTTINIAGQLPAGQSATGIEVVIDNQLNALSQTGTIAFIAKKDFTINIPNVPEPTTLAGVGLVSVLLRRRR